MESGRSTCRSGAFLPVASILLALILLGEEPSPALAAGSALMIVGIVLGRFGARALETLRAAGPRAKAALIQLKHWACRPDIVVQHRAPRKGRRAPGSRRTGWLRAQSFPERRPCVSEAPCLQLRNLEPGAARRGRWCA